ncbi:hypothetical protein AVEN_90291-1 [Araneus ventricosus]|uniref:Uncharacterized protein n=1 Tax=Araneus ventricosus TaxID=182803 RepID=A0A4Y2ULW5_ARAVE|nr:hypothetical protein AVEN_90291-1 [Araneus ventricosus]
MRQERRTKKKQKNKRNRRLADYGTNISKRKKPKGSDKTQRNSQIAWHCVIQEKSEETEEQEILISTTCSQKKTRRNKTDERNNDCK